MKILTWQASWLYLISKDYSLREYQPAWIKIFPDKPVTEKPAGTRMGSGKGTPEFWIANVHPGRVMFEIGGVSEDVAREALRRAIDKLPMKCRVIAREGGDI